jgi:hypothetical protein
MASDKFVDVSKPNLVKTRPFEIGKGEFKDSEGLFEVSSFPEEVSIVEEHDGGETTMLFASFISNLDSIKVAQIELKIDVELPK